MYDFDDIRPYNDSEFREAYYKLMDDPRFQDTVAKFLPNYTVEDLRRDFPKYHCVDDVQADFIRRWVELFVKHSTTRCEMSGIENIDPRQAYLFISNHRDITFDPAMLQYYFFIEHRRTSKIAIGDNLLKTPLLDQVGRLNKMVKVIRSGSLREKLANSQRLSAYIQYSLFEEKESVWIAQRDGRTKDGNDFTKQGLLKMVSMGREEDLIGKIKRMNIVPMSISYEFEPCAELKAREMALSENGQHYEKRPGEDFESIKQGIFDPKGQVTLVLGNPLHEELDSVPADLNVNDKLHYICKLIDNQIYANYKLYANNYIAHDLMYDNQDYAEFYTEEQKQKFEQYLQRKAVVRDVPKEKMMEYLLRLYGTPVDNFYKNQNNG